MMGFLHVLNWRDVASDGFVVLAAKQTQFEPVPRTGFLSAGQWKQGRETKPPPASPSSDPRSSAADSVHLRELPELELAASDRVESAEPPGPVGRLNLRLSSF